MVLGSDCLEQPFNSLTLLGTVYQVNDKTFSFSHRKKETDEREKERDEKVTTTTLHTSWCHVTPMHTFESSRLPESPTLSPFLARSDKEKKTRPWRDGKFVERDEGVVKGNSRMEGHLNILLYNGGILSQSQAVGDSSGLHGLTQEDSVVWTKKNEIMTESWMGFGRRSVLG